MGDTGSMARCSVDPTTGLTELETLFIREYVTNGGRKQESAIAAGYSKSSAHTRAWELLRKPRVVKAIAGFRRELYQHDATKARKVLSDLMMDNSVSDTVKKDIALAFIDRAGDKLPTELILSDKRTPEEIRDRLDALLSSGDKKGETEPYKH